MRKDNTEIYRVVISARVPGGEWKDTEFYGPFPDRSSSRDHQKRSGYVRDLYDKGLRKWRRQKLMVNNDHYLEWCDE